MPAPLVKLRGNGGQACGNQNHIKGDADPNIGDNQAIIAVAGWVSQSIGALIRPIPISA